MNISYLTQEDFNQLMNEAVLSPKKNIKKNITFKKFRKNAMYVDSFPPNNYYDFIADNLDSFVLYSAD